jgi:two-component system chemotaxis sensor kinase CheA
MNLVGELVLARNQLLQLTSTDEDSTFQAPVQHLNRVATDLQEAVMKTRMQPVGNAWTKLPRLVRDLSQANGKKIELEMVGAETELDRQILQSIGDPLVHMIRNSADHGIETPEERRRKEKPERGTIRLNAYHEGGHVILQVKDDGAGINAEVIRRKAVERGLVEAHVAAAMPDAQVLRFVFEPGFSTAAKITNVSGRGVGMDVVRSNIERIGGTVDLQSAVNAGTTVRIKIPLTLAIISALVVGAGGEAFAIPQIGVIELVRVTPESKALIQEVHGARFYRLRDTLLPLLDLGETLGLEPSAAGEEHSIVVCQIGEMRYGLIVTEVFDTQEIVVKPVGRMVKHLPVYAGCTILGDGRVIMILDTAGLAARGKVEQTEEQAKRVASDHTQRQASLHTEKRSLLLFDVGLESLQAVPLALVARLEEFPAKDVEHADGRWLVQYRGSLLPVIPAHEGIDMKAKDPRQVIVFTDGKRAMGLAVDAIRDIVEDRVRVETSASRPGVLGAAVINGRATEVIDTHYFLRLAHSDWFATDVTEEAVTRSRRLLLVDDSTFFLNMLEPVLTAAGYEVETAANGKEALARLEGGDSFGAVVSDIGMPEMDGLELARHIRANPAWNGLKLLALTGRVSKAERLRGAEAGFSHYLAKFDRDAVVAAVEEATAVAEEVAV